MDDIIKLKIMVDLIKIMYCYWKVMDDKEEFWGDLKLSFDKYLGKIKYCEDLVKMLEKLDEMW